MPKLTLIKQHVQQQTKVRHESASSQSSSMPAMCDPSCTNTTLADTMFIASSESDAVNTT